MINEEMRLKDLLEALKQIRGWREIGHAVTLGERIQAVEDIANEAIARFESQEKQ